MSVWSKLFNLFTWENAPSSKTPLGATLLQKINVALSGVDDRVIELDTRKMDISSTLKMVQSWVMDVSTGVITVTLKDGTVNMYDTALEKVPVSGRIDTATNKLIFTNSDGTTTEVDISKLVTQYEFVDTDTVGFAIAADGKVSCFVKDGSITEEKLETGYLANIKVEVAKAQAGAAQAVEMSCLSAEQAQESKSYAIGDTGIREGENTDNSKYYCDQAKQYRDQTQQIAGITTIINDTTPSVNQTYSSNKIEEIKSALDNGLGNKLEADGDSKDNTVTFTEATEDVDIVSGETHATLFGKILKSIKSLKTNKLTIGNDYRPSILNNGDFQLWSRGTSFTNQALIADSWTCGWDATGSNNIVSKQYDSQKNFNFLRYQCTAIGTGTNYRLLTNRLKKRLKIISGKTVTLSFMAKADTTRQIANTFVYVFGTGGSSAIGKYLPSVTLDTTWKQFTQTFTVESFAGKVFGEDNELCIDFTLPTNSTFTIDIANVKLEINDHSTPFIPKAYNEELLELSDGIGYKPNLITNSNFKVNQRNGNYTNITGTAVYCVDRWRLENGVNSSMTAMQLANGIKVSTSGTDYHNLAQPIDSKDFEDYRGKTVIIHLKANTTNYISGLGIYAVVDGVYGFLPATTLEQTNTDYIVQIQVPSIGNITYLSWMVCFPSNAPNTDIYWVKGEFNNHATSYIPRSYAEELAECQRYYERFNLYEIGFFDRSSNGSYWIRHKFREKRVAPTIKKHYLITMTCASNNALCFTQGPVEYTVSNVYNSKDSVTIVASGTDATIDQVAYAQVGQGPYVELDAEL